MLSLPRMLLFVALLMLLQSCLSAAPASSSSSSSSSASAASNAQPTLNYYQLFELQQDHHTPAVIKKAYRKAALLHHPDKAVDEKDRALKQALFVRLATAYETLSNRRLKSRYDYLLQHGVLDYDANRNWDEFDAQHGFKPKKKSKQQMNEEQQFKAAQELFKQAQEDAEEFAFWTAVTCALFVAIVPVIYLYYSRYTADLALKQKAKTRSNELKEQQQILQQLQREREQQEKQQRQEELEYQRQLRAERAAAAEAAAEQDDSASSSDDDGAHDESGDKPHDADEWEVVNKAKHNSDDNDDEEEEENDKASSKNKNLFKCAPCKKTFKSQAQLENHENSNQHKNKVKQSSRSRRDE